MSARFTRDGSARLEQRLAAICDEAGRKVAALLGRSLRGLALGGGYGRGEGGVLVDPATGDQPYNDIEFFAFVRGPLLWTRRRNPALQHLAHELSELHGIEIEFKMLTLRQLRRSQPTMFFYDLLMGHRWVTGDDSLFAGCGHHREAGRIPLHEATRLLMNRSSGLLFARERLARENFSTEDADFVARNIAKAWLALGDVLLTAHGQYHWSCTERHSRLAQLESPLKDDLRLLPLHEKGVDFKLHPRRSSAGRAELEPLHQQAAAAAQTVFLWLESRRLGQTFTTAAGYAGSPLDKCPETAAWKNRLINARLHGLAGLLDPRYPRQRLLHSLCHLLWQEQPLTATAMKSYHALWQRYN